MIDRVVTYLLPAAFSILPPAMETPEAAAMLLAIGLQESRFLQRRQGANGPARSFWQFEAAGLLAVLAHPRLGPTVDNAAATLRYAPLRDTPLMTLLQMIEHNDVLACAFARCLLATTVAPLPIEGDADHAWAMYQTCWRPGKPVRQTWNALYGEAWDRVRHRPATDTLRTSA
jgi:hypothetical protein